MNFLLLQVATLAALVFGQAQVDQCLTQTVVNPIWQLFPDNVTDVINATLALIPIPYDMARSIIPAKYGILTDAYKNLLPNIPDGLYPAIFQSEWDYDIRFGSITIPGFDPTQEGAHSAGDLNNTFSFQHASLAWPFIDLLGDGSTSFVWEPDTFVSAGAELAIDGVGIYGEVAYPAIFDPPCDAYMGFDGGFSVNATNSSDAFFQSVWWEPSEEFNYDEMIRFFNNVTNQPSFGNGSSCDNQIRLFSTNNTGIWAPNPVLGDILLQTPLLPDVIMCVGVTAIQIATPFIENDEVACSSMKDYGGRDVLPGWMSGTDVSSGNQ